MASRSTEDLNRTFFRALWSTVPEGYREVRAIRNDKTGVAARLWTLTNEGVMLFGGAHGRRDSGCSVYHGVCLRSGRGGKKSDVSAVTALWADVDTGKMGWDKLETARRIHDLPAPLSPSAIIDSGGGLHCYWFLAQPILLEPQKMDGWTGTVQYIEAANRRLGEILQGDAVGDITRILRTPGTWNAKHGKAGAKECGVIYCYPWERHRFRAIAEAAFAFDKVLGPNGFGDEAEDRPVPLTDMDRTLAAIEDFIRKYRGEDGRKARRPSNYLSTLWDSARLGGGVEQGRGYIGINEAITLSLAHCHTLGWDDDRTVGYTLGMAKEAKERSGDMAWNAVKEERAARASLERFKGKFRVSEEQYRKRKQRA